MRLVDKGYWILTANDRQLRSRGGGNSEDVNMVYRTLRTASSRQQLPSAVGVHRDAVDVLHVIWVAYGKPREWHLRSIHWLVIENCGIGATRVLDECERGVLAIWSDDVLGVVMPVPVEGRDAAKCVVISVIAPQLRSLVRNDGYVLSLAVSVFVEGG